MYDLDRDLQSMRRPTCAEWREHLAMSSIGFSGHWIIEVD